MYINPLKIFATLQFTHKSWYLQELGEVLRQCKANGKKTYAIYEGDYGANSLGTYFLASYFGTLKFFSTDRAKFNRIIFRQDLYARMLRYQLGWYPLRYALH